ncbi:RNA-binding Raly-like protein isoform X2 [Xyrauchen texanus]|uniref:RNA-binding Raly-like protein isoform X2 n=1 Tax=Xyrauchen texanus TaxID=154827 RepID=UPI002241F702|nr:RNA-binding Raly-like protein isoform X2 [Xyrauchen texanus]
MMTGVLRPTKQKPSMKRSRNEPYRDKYSKNGCYQDGYHDRVFDYHHVPISVTTIPCDFTPTQRPCSSSSASSTAMRRSKDKPTSRHKSRNRETQLRLEELLCIKKELTVIKSQIDELLDSLEQMNPQSQELSGCVGYSPLHGSVSSVDGSSCSAPLLSTDRKTHSPPTSESSDEDRHHVNDESDLYYM